MPPKKVGKKSKTTTKKTIKKSTTKKTIKKSKPRKENIITHTITAQILTQVPNPVIKQDNSNEGWKMIHNICETAIKFYKDFHQIKNCDRELTKFLIDVEKVARQSNILSEVLYVIRARQTLVEKFKQIKRIALSRI